MDLCWGYIRVMLGLYWVYVGVILGSCWSYIGFILGVYIEFILRLYWVYSIGLYWVILGVYSVYIIVILDFIRFTLGLHWDNIGFLSFSSSARASFSWRCSGCSSACTGNLLRVWGLRV